MLRGTWDLPGPGLEPMSPALAGGFLTTAPPGKSAIVFLEKKLQTRSRVPSWYEYSITFLFPQCIILNEKQNLRLHRTLVSSTLLIDSHPPQQKQKHKNKRKTRNSAIFPKTLGSCQLGEETRFSPTSRRLFCCFSFNISQW